MPVVIGARFIQGYSLNRYGLEHLRFTKIGFQLGMCTAWFETFIFLNHPNCTSFIRMTDASQMMRITTDLDQNKKF